MLQSNLNGERKSKHVINKSVIYVDKYFRSDTDYMSFSLLNNWSELFQKV